ncbi:MAG TPA: DUF3180 domain-containing protein [Pseudonocardiaceae bacterium]|jgi:hypothetical protein|nr:DUF3180 domain-containing protein [Pseudonocardiaceae bacterium]
MKFTRARDLVIAGVIAGVLVNLFLLLDYDAVPPLPGLAGITLLVLALIEAGLAWSLRGRIRRKPGTEPVRAMTAVRAVALAKASSVLGALMAGGWLGVLVYVLPRNALSTAAANDTTSGFVGLVCAAVLIAAALWLEYVCRTPKDNVDDRSEHDSRS